jgi:accessory gene regulator protein AgrB
MIVSAKIVCLIISLVLFALAAFFNWWRPDENRFNLVAAGLFFYALKDALA